MSIHSGLYKGYESCYIPVMETNKVPAQTHQISEEEREQRSAIAKELGRLGGLTTKSRLTQSHRSWIASNAAKARWAKNKAALTEGEAAVE